MKIDQEEQSFKLAPFLVNATKVCLVNSFLVCNCNSFTTDFRDSHEVCVKGQQRIGDRNTLGTSFTTNFDQSNHIWYVPMMEAIVFGISVQQDATQI